MQKQATGVLRLLVLVLVSSCVAETPPDEEDYAGGPLRYVTANVRSFGYGGGTARIDVVVPAGEPWSASADPWISLSRTAGAGPGSIQVSAGGNGGAARLGRIGIAGQTVTVMQQAQPTLPDAFQDISAYDANGTYADLMRTLGISRGCAGPPAPRFCGADTITRGQAAVFVVSALQVRAGLAPSAFTVPSTPYFPADVPDGHIFFRHIQRLRELGITAGCGGGAYCPDAPVTAGQLAVFVVRGLAGGDSVEHATTPFFTDVPSTHPFFRHVQKLRAIGAWDGCGGGLFCPDQPVTRAQAAAIILRTLLDAPRENGQCTLSCTGHACGSGDGCGTTCATGSGCVVASAERPATGPYPPPVPATLPYDDSLASNRSRLFHQMANAADRERWTCWQWLDLDDSQRNVFLTLTDRLQRTRLADGRSALSHVNQIYAVRGHERPGVCGGMEYNRLYFQADHMLHDALRLVWTHGGSVRLNDQPVLRDDAYGWRQSEDIAGPHRPFSASVETDRGGPRAQVHFFADPEAGESVVHTRPGIAGLRDGYLVEIDQDYNLAHDSSTECRYGVLCAYGIGCKTGAEMYTEMVRGGSDTVNFIPCDCPSNATPGDPPVTRCVTGSTGTPPPPPPSICWPQGFPCSIDRDCCSNYCSYPDPEDRQQVCVTGLSFAASRPAPCGDGVCEAGEESSATCPEDCPVAPVGPRINPGGIVNGVTYGAIRPGDIIAIFGSGFGGSGNVVELAGTGGSGFEGYWTASWYESAGQINLRLPTWLGAGGASARVWNGVAWSAWEPFTVWP